MKTEGKALSIVLWILQIFGAAMFLMAGVPKLTGSEQAIQTCLSSVEVRRWRWSFCWRWVSSHGEGAEGSRCATVIGTNR